MSEQWRAVPGYEGFYEVSDLGRVRSLDRTVPCSRWGTRRFSGITLRHVLSDRGYPQVSLTKDGQSRTKQVHRLVLEAFRGPCPPGHEACHNNGDPSDNRFENLRWDTRLENMRDVVRHGSHNNAKKTHCPRGHEYTPENTYLYRGKRNCLTCKLERARTD